MPPEGSGRLRLLVLACFQPGPLKDRVGHLLEPLAQELSGLPDVGHVQLELCEPDDAIAKLDAHYRPGAEATLPAAIVASDALIAQVRGRMTEVPVLTPFGTRLLDTFSDKLLGTVGATSWLERVCDIDRTIGFDFDDDDLIEALAKTVRTLAYKAPPLSREANHPIEVRCLKSVDELRESLRLRHRVYSIMGYFSYEVEANPARLEIDRYDRFSVPVGAFRTDEIPHRLVGTARVIVDEKTYEDAVQRGLVSRIDPSQINDLVADSYMAEEMGRALPFPLPVMISQPLELGFYYLQRIHFGELSRVIVDDHYRGTGLSKTLVNSALEQAQRVGVEQLFLECIPAHEGLYEKHGFLIMPGMRREVDNVYKRMIAMACPSPPLHERGAVSEQSLRPGGGNGPTTVAYQTAGTPSDQDDW